MINKRNSNALIISGVIFIVVSLSADLIYLGGDLNAFGWKQITGTVVGFVLLSIGIFLRLKIAEK